MSRSSTPARSLSMQPVQSRKATSAYTGVPDWWGGKRRRTDSSRSAFPELEQLRGGRPRHRQVDALSHPVPPDPALAHRALEHVAQGIDVLALGSGAEAFPSMGAPARDHGPEVLEVRLDVACGDLAQVDHPALREEAGCHREPMARVTEVVLGQLASPGGFLKRVNVVAGIWLDPVQLCPRHTIRMSPAEVAQLLKPPVEEHRRRLFAAGSEACSIRDERLQPSTPWGPSAEVAVSTAVDPDDVAAWLPGCLPPPGPPAAAGLWHGVVLSLRVDAGQPRASAPLNRARARGGDGATRSASRTAGRAPPGSPAPGPPRPAGPRPA